jgi:hypothetical protein
MSNGDKVDIKVAIFDKNYNFFISDHLECQIYNIKFEIM